MTKAKAERKPVPAELLPKVEKLLAALWALQEQEAAIINELRTVLGGGQSIADRMRVTEGAFAAAWSARYGTRYVWTYAKELALMKRLLATFTVEDLARRFERYLSNNDPFFTKTRHSFGAFVASVNQHALPVANDAPIFEELDDDAAATARRLADLKR